MNEAFGSNNLSSKVVGSIPIPENIRLMFVCLVPGRIIFNTYWRRYYINLEFHSLGTLSTEPGKYEILCYFYLFCY